uniref:Phospholipase A2 n=1 Tax=Caenorhabditis tropicalis TaxID=1561998 RepID=A0A1I7TNW6_9PELO
MSSRLLLLLLSLIPMISCLELRNRRSVAPFLGSGSSSPSGMHIPQEHWHCGSDSMSRNISYNQVSPHCPSLTAALNHCCAIHDDCYGQQNGQNKCDEEFCECNRMVTRLPTEEGYKCRATTQDACVILQLFGGFAYGDSNYTDPAKGSGNVLMTPKTLPETEGDYMNLYSKCPHVNITLASCAFNFDLCALAHSADFCANDLCHCMLDAAESDRLHKKECLPAVAHTCRAVLKHSSLVLASDVAMKNFVNSCFVVAGLLILAACSFGFGLFFMYARVGGYRKKQHDDGKYIQIHTVESSRSVNPLLLNAD